MNAQEKKAKIDAIIASLLEETKGFPEFLFEMIISNIKVKREIQNCNRESEYLREELRRMK